MNKNLLIMIVLAVLVLVSAVQAVQLNDLRTKIASGEIKTTGAATSTGSSGAASVPSSIQNLPSMVGGC